MINFNYETDFNLDNEDGVAAWLGSYYLGKQERRRDKLCFCDDEYLHINVEYLDHDTLTDIISFDYSIGNELHGIFSFLSKELKTTLLTLMFL
jgi:ssRNA-specific RNase YbeY (16S rRNA maturation enzyme)